jgi:Ca2+-dependent lipid-binding protein
MFEEEALRNAQEASYKTEHPNQLQVVIFRASDLVVMDYGILGKGTSDPYVKVNLLVANGLNNYVSKSATKMRDLNPEWNEKHEIDVTDINDGNTHSKHYKNV